MTTSRETPATPAQAIGTAHRLEDGRVLTTPEEHATYARELAMQAAEDAALATSQATPPSRSSSEALTDG